MSRLRSQTACRLRDDPRTLDHESETCESINLGLLSRQFPDICEPTRATKSDPRSITELHKAIIGTRHLQDMAGLACGFARKHEACDVGSIIQLEALAYVHGVRGRELDPIVSRVMVPIWAADAVARLQNADPDARIQLRMHEICRSTFTERVVQWSSNTSVPHGTVVVDAPEVHCVDCSVRCLLELDDMGNRMEKHLKTDGHRNRVERRSAEGGEDRLS